MSPQASPTHPLCLQQPSGLARCLLKPTLFLLQLKHIILGVTSFFPQPNFSKVNWRYSSAGKVLAQHTWAPENHRNQSWQWRDVCNPRHWEDRSKDVSLALTHQKPLSAPGCTWQFLHLHLTCSDFPRYCEGCLTTPRATSSLFLPCSALWGLTPYVSSQISAG